MAIDWLNRLCKWRSVFAAWQLGTRLSSDPEAQAVRDHRELSMLMRAEINAQSALLIRKGVFTAEELGTQLMEEARHLSIAYERKFPGMKATDHGITFDMAIARDTMAGWRP